MFDRFRILCAVRKGTYGVENLNRTVEQILIEEGIISVKDQWYAGRPVMISENDYSLGLFNGDVGIAFPDPSSENDLKVFFVEKDGRTRSIRPDKLPAHETAYAMTIHKGQGSEFDNVFIILPERETPVLSRELIYTAITRAKNRVCLMSDLHVLCHAVEHQTERRSGLRDALWG
jgi:exodeoxyribonuclease V alpha subunit